MIISWERKKIYRFILIKSNLMLILLVFFTFTCTKIEQMVDLLYYNPFMQVDEVALRKLIVMRKHHVVVQRFRWPGHPMQKTFLMSAYADEHEALLHGQELSAAEGKVQNLLDITQYQNMLKLLQIRSGIGLFFAGSIDIKHEKKLQKAYVNAVSAYISNIRMKKDGHYHVRIYVEYGRVKADITSGAQSHTALFYDMIK